MKPVNSIFKNIILASAIVYVLLLFIQLLTYYGLKFQIISFRTTSNPNHRNVISPIAGESYLIQEFVPPEDDLCTINLLVIKGNVKSESSLLVSLYEGNQIEDGKLIFEKTYPGDSNSNKNLISVEIPNIQDSSKHSYLLKLSFPQSNIGDEYGFAGSDPTVFHDFPKLSLYQAENNEMKILPGAILFGGYICPDKTVFERLTADKPDLISAKVFKFLFFAEFIGVIGLLYLILNNKQE